MERFFDDSVIRGLATKAQQWGPSNVALQRGPDPKSIVMGVPMTGGPVTGVGGGSGFLCTSLSACDASLEKLRSKLKYFSAKKKRKS